METIHRATCTSKSVPPYKMEAKTQTQVALFVTRASELSILLFSLLYSSVISTDVPTPVGYIPLDDNLENQFNKQNRQINLHKAQLSCNEERFRLLESTCYNGKLIWKITDYERKKREAVEGRVVSIFSQHFYTSRCGYRLCARAYLNGDGSGRGNYLSLYFVVMKGEFDSLLSWPFKQKVTLMLLDQSGKKNNIIDVFKADPHSTSFKRPEGEMNIASGCPRFASHNQLENPRNGCYIKDDTLFIKVVVDLTDLEEL